MQKPPGIIMNCRRCAEPFLSQGKGPPRYCPDCRSFCVRCRIKPKFTSSTSYCRECRDADPKYQAAQRRYQQGAEGKARASIRKKLRHKIYLGQLQPECCAVCGTDKNVVMFLPEPRESALVWLCRTHHAEMRGTVGSQFKTYAPIGVGAQRVKEKMPE